MNKKIIKIIIVILLIFTIVNPLIPGVIINEIKTSGINIIYPDIIVTPGITACIIEYGVPEIFNNTKIYYGESSPVTLSDICTYTDPIDCNKDYRINRKMFFGPLKEETIYYYRVYNTNKSEWLSEEGSFKTLKRYNKNTGWSDNFFDTFLIDTSNNVNIVQQIGIKDVDNPFFWDDRDVSSPPGDRKGWTGWISNSNQEGRWDGWFRNRSDGTNGHYYTSYDGKDWIRQNEMQARYLCCEKKYNVNTGKWWTMAHVSGGRGDVYIGDSIDGPLDLILEKALDRTKVDGNEIDQRSKINDTLRCNVFLLTGQCNTDDYKGRFIGQFIGLNQTDWLHWDIAFRYFIAAPAGESGEQHYSFNGYIDAGLYVFFLSYWHDDDTLDVYLLTSRNGWDWTYIDPTAPIIPLGRFGSWDGGMTLDTSVDRITEGDYEYRYYGGFDGTHDAPYRKSGIGRIQYRKDGLTSIKPFSNDAWFQTVSIPEVFRYNFRINGNFSESSKLNIMVLNATAGEVYPGFDLSDSDTINENSLNIVPTWGDGSRILSDIPNGDFKLLFKWDGMDGGELFSYDLSGDMDSDNPYPPEIYGPNNGKVRTNYNYTLNSKSPAGKDVYYLVDWGDGIIEDWFGPFTSGEDATASHKWTRTDTYTIKARAKDIDDIMGPWSSFEVTIPRIRTATNTIWYQWFLERFPMLERLLRFIL